MKKFDYLIIAGGKLPSAFFLKKTLHLGSRFVAVDRGFDTFKKLKIKPDIFVGDGDSVSSKPVAKKMILLPSRKSISDLEFAIKSLPTSASKLILAAHQDSEERSDHALVNLLLALKYKNIFFVDENSWMMGLQNQKIKFKIASSKTFTLTSPFKVRVKIQGARYTLSNVVLQTPTHGLSNQTLVNKWTTLSVKGRALLFVNQSWSKSKIIL